MSDYALEFYTFVADNYAPFYSTPIECTERDAGYVLDGLLYHESDLEIDEHYTDTHGYTEVQFAAFALLGKRFAPRIRGLPAHPGPAQAADLPRLGRAGALRAALATALLSRTGGCAWTTSPSSGTRSDASSARSARVTRRRRWP